jgi:hypothetical protein
VPQWDREATQTTLTQPHRRLLKLLKELGLEVTVEVRVERYSLDCFAEEVWCGFEADGWRTHAGLKKRARDAVRDRWIFDNARIPVLRVDENALRPAVWPETKKLVMEFIERYSQDVEQRKEQGRWVVDV